MLSVGLLEYRGECVGSARVADLFLESLFDTQNSLLDLVQPVGLILGLLPGRDVGFHCGFFCGCLGRLVFRFLEDIFVVVCMLCCDGVDVVLGSLKQFAHAVGFVQWVELFFGHLFELFDELDDVIVLVLASVIDCQFDLFQLFNCVDFVFASSAPNRIAHGVGRVGILVPVTLVLKS